MNVPIKSPTLQLHLRALRVNKKGGWPHAKTAKNAKAREGEGTPARVTSDCPHPRPPSPETLRQSRPEEPPNLGADIVLARPGLDPESTFDISPPIILSLSKDERAGMSQQYISDLERGRPLPKLRVELRAQAEAIGSARPHPCRPGVGSRAWGSAER
jgi:hypothetical protein